MTARRDRAEATRQQLVTIAKRLFAEHGYEGASMDAVQRQAGVSRGALYHHFASKQAMFEAVLDSVEGDIAETLVAATEHATDPLERLRLGSLAWLELAIDPVIQRIALLDAPAVIGWEVQRAVDQRHTLGLVKATLAVLAADGRLPAESVDPIAHVLLAGLNELALYVAGAEDSQRALRQATIALDLLLERLFAPATLRT